MTPDINAWQAYQPLAPTHDTLMIESRHIKTSLLLAMQRISDLSTLVVLLSLPSAPNLGRPSEARMRRRVASIDRSCRFVQGRGRFS